MRTILEFLSKSYRPYLAVLLVLLGIAIVPAIKLQPLDRDESRFMQATTQMFETGDFVSIRFQDEARNKKPVGIYWLQAAVLAPLGKGLSHDAFYFRIASILGAFLAAVSTFLLGARLYDRKIGLVAALIFSSSLLLSTEAHIAKTDAALTGFTVLAIYALAKIRFDGVKNAQFLFWFAFAVAVLIKGPVTIMIIGLMLLVLWFLDKNLRWAKPLLDIRAIALFLALIIPWFVAIGIITKGQFFAESIGKDLGEKVSGTHENKPLPPGLHLAALPLLVWPYTLFLGAFLSYVFVTLKDDKTKFLLAALIPAWIVFELSPAKLIHYTLPVHFAIALLMAKSIFDGHFKSWAKWGGLVLALLVSFIVIYIPISLEAPSLKLLEVKDLIIPIAILAPIIIAISLSIFNSRKTAVFLLLASAMFAILVKGDLLANSAEFNLSQRINDRLIALNLHPRLSKVAQNFNLIGGGYQEPSLIFLTKSNAKLADIPTSVKIAKPGDGVVIDERDIKTFGNGLFARGLEFIRDEMPIKGLNYSKGDEVTIYVGRVQSRAQQ